ncbi:MAG: NEW3 domain-containing protein [Desulfobacterales bacterium]|nr:NEW3 domain-containing protein [Desulfobacterales bacterium]
MRTTVRFGMWFAVAALLVSLAAAADAAAQKAEGAPRPERLLLMAAEYPGVVAPQGKEVNMDLTFFNKGRTDETVDVRIAQKPDGWKARIKTYRFTVTGVHVPADDKKSLTFEAIPDKELPPGEYSFLIEATTRDGRFKLSEKLRVTLAGDQEGQAQDQPVRLTTSYPVIRGPSNAAFEFSVEVDSRLDKEAIFDLSAQGPAGWEVNFKPAYESKYISSLRIRPNQSQSIAVEVKPGPGAAAGEYPVTVRVAAGEAKGEANLTVMLTGTYELEVGTPSGLLSLEAHQGRASNVSFYVKNSGTAPNTNIRFMSFKPENWKVEFKPERIDLIEPNALKQVEMIITPADEALVGDYSVAVRIEGEKSSKTLEFRIGVKASSVWGWVGIGIIVAVIAGLFGLFRAFGRR